MTLGVLPIGTQVVALIEVRGVDGKPMHPRGAVGIITQSPSDVWHSYRVRFVDGFEASFKRNDITILSHYQTEAVGGESAGSQAAHDLYPHVIYRCVVGSRAYGLDNEHSDTDRRGVFLPPADRHWSLFGVPEQLEDSTKDEAYWEIQKFLVLALKANPNVLECLYTPMVEHAAPLAQEMLEMRAAFLSKMVYQTYNGYVLSQFKKLQSDVRNNGEIKWKHAMHLIRLLLAGITVLEEGFVPVYVGTNRDRLLAIRRGEVPFAEIEAWRLELHKRFDVAATETKLPEKPDYERVNAFLIRARRSVVSG